jgi:hypothetical protein
MENNGCSTKVNINNLIHTHNSYSFSSSSYSSPPNNHNHNNNESDNNNNKNNLIIQQLKNVII